MKIFDYRHVNLKCFVLLLGDTLTVWKQVLLFPTHVDLIVQHRASCGYVAINTKDNTGTLEPRDLIKVVGGGQAHLLFDTDANVTMNYWTDSDLYNWWNNDPSQWHVIKRVPRQRVYH